MSKRIAVSGATGFIGQHSLGTFLGAGHEVTALTRRPQLLPESEGLRVVQGDLTDPDARRRFLDGADAVLHLGGLIKARASGDFWEINHKATEALVGDAEFAVPRAHFIYVSSLAAREPELGPYGASKAAGEGSLRESGLKSWSIVRPPVVYGPGDKETLTFFKTVAKGWIPCPAGVRSRLSMIHVQDLSEAFLHLVEGDALGGPLEIDDGRERGHSWTELGRIAASVLGRRASTLPLPRPVLWGVGAGNEAIARLAGRPAMVTRAKVREFYHHDWVAHEPLLQSRSQWRPSMQIEKGFKQTIASYLASNEL